MRPRGAWRAGDVNVVGVVSLHQLRRDHHNANDTAVTGVGVWIQTIVTDPRITNERRLRQQSPVRQLQM